LTALINYEKYKINFLPIQIKTIEVNKYIFFAQTATFIRQHLYNESTERLLRTVYNDKNGGGVSQLANPIGGFVDDYAFLIRGLLDLYEAGFDWHWVEWALELQEIQNQLFWDESLHGFFTSPEGDPSIVLRLKEDQVSQLKIKGRMANPKYRSKHLGDF
jgi:uncharacterized protein YyaL (SSP411 family)